MKGQRRTHRKTHIPNRILIDLRPKYIERRKKIGHWESDTMMGLKQKDSGLTFTVERKTRLTKVRKTNKITAARNSKNIRDSLRTVPEEARLSITYDNGKENVGTRKDQ